MSPSFMGVGDNLSQPRSPTPQRSGWGSAMLCSWPGLPHFSLPLAFRPLLHQALQGLRCGQGALNYSTRHLPEGGIKDGLCDLRKVTLSLWAYFPTGCFYTTCVCPSLMQGALALYTIIPSSAQTRLLEPLPTLLPPMYGHLGACSLSLNPSPLNPPLSFSPPPHHHQCPG